MRLVRIHVRDFAAIEEARVELGGGLNVLHGPNDLGKSTLAKAIRAALLLPDGSAAHRELVPWHRDAAPFVELVFQGDDGRYYRVRKQFSDDGRRSSTLDYSNDNITFANDSKGRAVDDRLRSLLGWGFPATGGRGGPRGLPESFISNALLAEQTAVDKILSESLASDPNESGRVRLQNALSALVQNPAVKAVLDAAQAEVDRYFTTTGRKKGGANSEFKRASAKVKHAEDHFAELRRQLADSESVEREVSDKERERDAAQEALDEATTRVDRAARAVQARRAIEAADGLVAQAERALARIREADDAVAQAEQTLSQREETAAQAVNEEKAAQARVDAALRDARTAEQGLTRAQSQDGQQANAVEEAKLREEDAKLETALTRDQARRDNARAAVVAIADAEEADRKHDALAREVEGQQKAQTQAKSTLDDAERSVEAAKALRRYGAFQDVKRQLDDAIEAENALAADRARLETLEAEVADKRRALEALRAPEPEVVRRVTALHQTLATATAAAGAGLRVDIERLQPVEVQTQADGEAPRPHAADRAPIALTARGEAALRIGDVASIRLRSGSETAHRDLDRARDAWAAEGPSVLAAAGVDDVDALGALRREADGLRVALDAVERDRDALAQRVGEATASPLDVGALRDRVAAREIELGDVDRDAVAKAFESLGSDPEHAISTLLRRGEDAVSSARSAVTEADHAMTRLEADLRHAADAATDAARRRDAVRGEIDGDPAELAHRVEASLEQARNRRTAIAERIASLAASADEPIQRAQAAVGEAEAAVESAKAAHASAATRRRDAERERDAQQGRLESLRNQAASFDRDADARAHATAVEAKRALPEPELSLSEEDLKRLAATKAECRRRLDSATRELAERKGALEHVGGSVLRERLAEAERALRTATAENEELEIRANAWKLLCEAVQEAQATTSAHIGRKLAVPVQARFQELTDGRYGQVELAPELTTQGVHLAGAPRETKALSVGTREQLATLLRLAIAEALQAPIVLDDHLVQSDATRLRWFRDTLLQAANHTQVIVLTCRAEDYAVDTPEAARVVALEGAIRRWQAGSGESAAAPA